MRRRSRSTSTLGAAVSSPSSIGGVCGWHARVKRGGGAKYSRHRCIIAGVTAAAAGFSLWQFPERICAAVVQLGIALDRYRRPPRTTLFMSLLSSCLVMSLVAASAHRRRICHRQLARVVTEPALP